MSDIISLSAVILAALIHATLQLTLGGLLLLYHASFGAHPREKTRVLVSSYLSGVGIQTFLFLAATAFILLVILDPDYHKTHLFILAVLLGFMALAAWFLYYRHGKSTELWLPRAIAEYIDDRAKETDSHFEAFSLGLLTCFAELPFTIVLISTSAYHILLLPQALQILAIAIYVLITLVPMLTMRYFIRSGRNLAEIQRWRVRNKTFFRILSGFEFLVLAAFIIAFGVVGVAL